MTIDELAALCNEAVRAGHGSARVMFDTDAACYRVCLVEVRAALESAETTVDGEPMLLLSPPTYHGTCGGRSNRGPPFAFNSYWGEDGIPVVHVNTENMQEDSNGPICRIYLNDEAVWENPELPEEE